MSCRGCDSPSMRFGSFPTTYQAERRLLEEIMTSSPISRRVFLVIGATGVLTVATGAGGQPRVHAADQAPEMDYIAVFSRANQPLAVIEKPKGVPTGIGTSIEIDSFPLRTETVDATQARRLRQRMPEMDPTTSRTLPQGFRVYADKQSVEPSYASASRRFTIKVSDPVDGLHANGASDCSGGM